MRAGGGTSAAVTWWWDSVFGGVGTTCLSEEVKEHREEQLPLEEFHFVSQRLPSPDAQTQTSANTTCCRLRSKRRSRSFYLWKSDFSRRGRRSLGRRQTPWSEEPSRGALLKGLFLFSLSRLFLFPFFQSGGGSFFFFLRLFLTASEVCKPSGAVRLADVQPAPLKAPSAPAVVSGICVTSRGAPEGGGGRGGRSMR